MLEKHFEFNASHQKAYNRGTLPYINMETTGNDLIIYKDDPTSQTTGRKKII